MVDLSQRSNEPEWMDTKPVGLETFRHCLQDLCWLNQLSFGYRPTLSWLHGEIEHRQLPSFRLLDVGFGYGDMLRKIDQYCDQHDLDAELVGVDLHPYAQQVAASGGSSAIGLMGLLIVFLQADRAPARDNRPPRPK